MNSIPILGISKNSVWPLLKHNGVTLCDSDRLYFHTVKIIVLDQLTFARQAN